MKPSVDSEGTGSQEPPCILLVDDEKNVLITVRDLLEFSGYTVITAASGHEALAQLKSALPHLILLDVMMPGLDGGEVAQLIHEIPALADVPILFLTAAVSEEEVNENNGQIAGEAFFSKAGDPADLLKRIAQMLRERQVA